MSNLRVIYCFGRKFTVVHIIRTRSLSRSSRRVRLHRAGSPRKNDLWTTRHRHKPKTRKHANAQQPCTRRCQSAEFWMCYLCVRLACGLMNRRHTGDRTNTRSWFMWFVSRCKRAKCWHTSSRAACCVPFARRNATFLIGLLNMI